MLIKGPNANKHLIPKCIIPILELWAEIKNAAVHLVNMLPLHTFWSKVTEMIRSLM